ncbi:hypothetical protein NEHOM01_2392 [Nematocida homosporus]|uniref:uncharacterized protein n=1 Tax=Nematocida homosporus TaxID=1912981 RepID=UPI002220730E|nr:uncharacterized protein NEHOM01_2392 [Nematocida homosporus]KAI5187820.1 hypothetical protein NEHOM01_2392 [Nematocida homosporus]
MKLSLLMKTLSYLYVQNNSIHSFKCPSTHQHASRMAIPTTNKSATNPTRRCTHWALTTMLVLLNCVHVASRTGLEDPPKLPTANEIHKVLVSIGFTNDFGPQDLKVEAYTPHQPLESAPDTNTNPISAQLDSTQNKTPSYVIHTSLRRITFHLPTYPDATRAQAALEELRKIAVLKTCYATVEFSGYNPILTQYNMLILCRVVNMLSCERICFWFAGCQMLDGYTDGLNVNECQAEAQKTVEHAGRPEIHLTIVPSWQALPFEKFMLINLVVLRPILTLKLNYSHIAKFSTYLESIPFQDRYTLKINWTPGPKGCFDLEALRFSHHNCKMIEIKIQKPSKLDQLTLKNLPDKDPPIALMADWSDIRRIAMVNDSPTKVHTIITNWDGPYTIQEMKTAYTLPKRPKAGLIATKMIINAGRGSPCAPHTDCQVIYIKTLRKHGISVECLELNYANGRQDFHSALNWLSRINTSSEELIGWNDRLPECRGHALSNPLWWHVAPLNIQLDKISNWWTDYSYSCQHIRYTTINICGAKKPAANQLSLCIEALDWFKNITAHELCISNVRTDEACSELEELETLLNRYPKYHINLNKLVLDKVDLRLVYRMLYQCLFACQTEIHIINHNLPNLAVAKVLAHNETRNITKLVIVGLNNLIEASPDSQENTTEGFSLFNYVKDYEGMKTPQELGLHKLFLQQGYLDPHIPTLQDIKAFGVQVMPNLAEQYNAMVQFGQPSLIHDKELTYYSNTLEALETSFTDHPIATRDQDNSVKKLFLCISDKPFLTNADVISIIRWVACRFKKLVVLWLANLKLTDNERETITSCEYMIIGLPLLKSIHLEDPTADTGSINLLFRPYDNNILPISPDSEASFTALSYKLLSLLYAYCNNIQDLIPNYNEINMASLKMIIEKLHYYKTNGWLLDCPICFSELCAQPMLIRQDMGPASYCNGNAIAACFLKCGHPICIECASTMESDQAETAQDKRCSCCNRTGIFEAFKQLMCTSSSTCNFLNDQTNGFTANPDDPSPTPWTDGNYYFYKPYETMSTLTQNLSNEINTNPAHLTQIVDPNTNPRLTQ